MLTSTSFTQTDGSPKWRDRVDGLVDGAIRDFFPDGVAFEVPCETNMTCTTDMLSFKGYLHRWLAAATTVAPFIAPKVLPVLRSSAEAAISTCTGEADGRTCGFQWAKRQYDGSKGAGQQMNVLGAVSALMVEHNPDYVFVTADSGGTSKGDPNAGMNSKQYNPGELPPVTARDRAGAGVVTAVLVVSVVGTFLWMSMGR